VAEAARFDPSVWPGSAATCSTGSTPTARWAATPEHERRRTATLTCRRDGSGDLRRPPAPAALAQWQAVLDPLAAPKPSDADGPDPRTPGQRMHDALTDAAGRLLASGELPPSGGTPASVLLTMSLDQLETRTGQVTTAHGGT